MPLFQSNTSLNIGHVGSKNRAQGQILEKPCICCRGHIVSLVHMKLGQNVCLDETSDEFENRLCRVENRSLGHILEKPIVRFRSHIFSLILMKLGQSVCLLKWVMWGLKLGH